MIGYIFMFLIPDGSIVGYNAGGFSNVVDKEDDAKVYRCKKVSVEKRLRLIQTNLILAWNDPKNPLSKQTRWKNTRLEEIRVWAQIVPY
jgi:hypothetical protein